MSNYVASLISLYENAKAAKGGNILRHASVVGHASKVITKIASGQAGEAPAKLCQGIVDTFNRATEGSKVGNIVRKGVKLSRNTDPISATCAMIRVCKSDTPARAFLEEASDIMGMFIVEGSMIKYAKDIANIKGIKTLNDGMVNFCKGKKGLNVVPAVVYGVLFTVGSMVGSNAFRKAGSWVADKLGLPKSQQEPDNHKTADGKTKYYFG